MNYFIAFIIVLLSSTSFSKDIKVKLDKVFKLDNVIWGIDFIEKDKIVVSLRSGQLYLVDLITKKKFLLQSPKVEQGGQGGLLDVKYYAPKSYLYMTFSEKIEGVVTTSLARGVLKNNVLTSIKVIFRSKVFSDTTRHFGSRIAIKNDAIFMTVGDRGFREYAQKLDFHNGKILKLDLDGNFFKDNPFVNTPNALSEIYSLGHRNPQGIDFDPKTNQLYSCEFGPKGGDELNLIKPGNNYGWPIITYGKEYYGLSIGTTHKTGLIQPVTHWTPSISPSGMTFYIGDKIKEWQGDLFLAALGSRHLRRLVLEDEKVIKQYKYFESENERFRMIRNSPDGYLYLTTDSGNIYKVVENNENL